MRAPATKSLKRLSKQMAHAMYKNYGCGIAAPQVGVIKRLVVIDVDWDGEKGEKNPIVLVNPEIVELGRRAGGGRRGLSFVPGRHRAGEAPAVGPASSTTIWTASCGRSRATACSAAACSTRSTT